MNANKRKDIKLLISVLFSTCRGHGQLLQNQFRLMALKPISFLQYIFFQLILLTTL
jgi:hypothetical protein